MRHTDTVFRRFCVSGLAALVLVSAVALPRAAGAWTSSYRRTDVYHYDSLDARQMQRQSISAAEEARREGAREKRREEVSQQKEQSEREYLASQEEIRASSRAAATAPRGHFYRKPGSTAATLPGAAVEVKVGEQAYHYFSGIFYRQLPTGYIVVPAPVGAVVDALPEGAGAAVYKDDASTYFYYFGAFFTAEGDKYKVVDPPAGTVVGYVPDGYTETQVDGSPRYQFGDLNFAPVFFQDLLVYQVVKA